MPYTSPQRENNQFVAWCSVTAAFGRHLNMIIQLHKNIIQNNIKNTAFWKTFLTVKYQICFVYAREGKAMT